MWGGEKSWTILNLKLYCSSSIKLTRARTLSCVCTYSMWAQMQTHDANHTHLALGIFYNTQAFKRHSWWKPCPSIDKVTERTRLCEVWETWFVTRSTQRPLKTETADNPAGYLCTILIFSFLTSDWLICLSCMERSVFNLHSYWTGLNVNWPCTLIVIRQVD